MASDNKAPVPNSSSAQFFLKDYDGTLFPLSTNRLLVAAHAREISEFIQSEDLTGSGSFLQQHRVFASKRGWFLRPTVKLDPVAEFYLYDFVYRNRALFRKPAIPNRKSFGFRIVKGEASPILDSYAMFKSRSPMNAAVTSITFTSMSPHISITYITTTWLSGWKMLEGRLKT
jgi:hypothetical protein